MENITFWTTNRNKLKEVSWILWKEISWYTESDLQKIKNLPDSDVPEIQSRDIKTIAELKAKAVHSLLWRLVIVEDTWFFINAYNGFPWAFIKYTITDIGNKWILKLMEWVSNRTAKAITAVSLYNWNDYITGYWEVEWIITNTERKWQWKVFWYDSIFQPNCSNKTYAEMSDEEKNSISMRKIALENFLKKYNDYYESFKWN